MADQQIGVFLTSYWPFQQGLTPQQRKLEGGTNDRKGKPLYTLEDHKAGLAPYVSLAGDPKVFAYGQQLVIPALGVRDDGSEVIAKVVDTGGHFTGPGKVYRHYPDEPIDVCVLSSASQKEQGFGGSTTATVKGANIAGKISDALDDPEKKKRSSSRARSRSGSARSRRSTTSGVK